MSSNIDQNCGAHDRHANIISAVVERACGVVDSDPPLWHVLKKYDCFVWLWLLFEYRGKRFLRGRIERGGEWDVSAVVAIDREAERTRLHVEREAFRLEIEIF